MALVRMNGRTTIPRQMWNAATVPAFSTQTLDSTADRWAPIFQAPHGISIDAVAVSVGAVATPEALDVRIETLGTSNANPTGTLWAANTNKVIAAPSADSVVVAILDAVANVSQGQEFAVVVQPNASPVSIVMNSVSNTAASPGPGTFPYLAFNLTGSFSTSINQGCVAVRDATSGLWINLNGVGPILSMGTSAINTGTGATTGTMRGARMRFKTPLLLNGGWFKMNQPAAADFEIRLYSDAGALLATLLVRDGSIVASTANAGHYLTFVSDELIATNTWVRIVVVPTTANSITMYEYAVADAAHWDAFDGGQDVHLTAFIGGVWVDEPLQRPWMGVFTNYGDDGSGGGGGSANTGSIFSTPIVRVA